MTKPRPALFEWRHFEPENHCLCGPLVSTALLTVESHSAFTGSGLADVLLGLPTALRNQYNRGYFYFQQKEIAVMLTTRGS